MIRKFTSLLLALMLSLLSTSAVFAASYPSPPSVTEDAAASSGDKLSPIGAVIKGANDTALATEGDYTSLTCNDVGNLKVQIEPTRKATYVADSGLITPAASLGELGTIYGSGSKTIKILDIRMVYYQTGVSSVSSRSTISLIKQSSAFSGGTSSTVSAVPYDSASAAASATVKSFTANPTAGSSLGTLATTTAVGEWAPSVAVTNSCAPRENVLFDHKLCGQPIVLRGTSEGVGINGGGTTMSGTSPTASFKITWTEESSIGFLFFYLGRLILPLVRRKRVTFQSVFMFSKKAVA